MLSGSFIQKKEKAIPAWGVNQILITDKPVLNRSGIVITVDSEHIAGITETTCARPEIGKRGKK